LKKSLKYLSTLILVPFLVFLRGDMDLSVNTFLFGDQVSAVLDTKNDIEEQWKAKTIYSFEVNTEVEAIHEGFTGEGLQVHLYDSTYQLIAKSQIAHGKVLFQLAQASDTATLQYVVLPSTATEIKVSYTGQNPALPVEEAEL
jgi:hypothetical protein